MRRASTIHRILALGLVAAAAQGGACSSGSTGGSGGGHGGPVCGDGTCEPGETCGSCEQDCGACPALCGNGTCEPGESCGSCPGDCGECCGNGACEASLGEDCGTCPDDCGSCCGNGQCEQSRGESCDTCADDCGSCCGNGKCEPGYGENCGNCAADCGGCCGNGKCDSAYGETCSTCPDECTGCCGDGYCSAVETWGDCWPDCWSAAPAMQFGICSGGPWIADWAGPDYLWIDQTSWHLMWQASNNDNPVTFTDLVYNSNGYFYQNNVNTNMTVACGKTSTNDCVVFLYRNGKYVDVVVDSTGYYLNDGGTFVSCP